MNPERVVIAEILRPRGNRGELLVRSQTDIPDRLRTLNIAHVQLADGSDTVVHILQAWPHKDAWVVKFSDVDSIEAADRFRGGDLWVPLVERGQLPQGEFFQADLIGCSLLDQDGTVVGEVENFEQYGSAPPLLVVNCRGREVLVPFVPEQCRVDLTSREIRMTIPEGLLDL